MNSEACKAANALDASLFMKAFLHGREMIR